MYDLKSTREAKRLTADALSHLAGCSPGTISLIETGKRRPSVNMAKRIGAALGFDWTLFFEDDNDVRTETEKGAEADVL